VCSSRDGWLSSVVDSAEEEDVRACACENGQDGASLLCVLMGYCSPSVGVSCPLMRDRMSDVTGLPTLARLLSENSYTGRSGTDSTFRSLLKSSLVSSGCGLCMRKLEVCNDSSRL
jgi:hypothetical protein